MVKPHSISRLRKVDWDFAGCLSESAFSSIHWYPARFASQLPATLIGVLTEPGQVVLDIFVGSGTTLVEAQRLGRDSIGIDINPVACLLSRAKTFAASANTVGKLVDDLKREAVQALSAMTPSDPDLPPGVQPKWYNAAVRRDLARLWIVLQKYEGKEKILSDAAFSALLLPVCRETRHWGYVCDNSTPSGSHGADVLARYCETLDRFVEAYRDRDVDLLARFGNVAQAGKSKIICGDARSELAKLPASSIDLILTSPPYFGVSDYVKAQRLSMEWFSHTIEPLRQNEIGARSKRHRNSAVEEYTSDLATCFELAKRTLKPGGACVLIVGESGTRESVLAKVISAVKTVGFELRLDQNRRVSSQRRQAPSIVGEHLLVFSNP
jgi:DNA modification methylase